MTEQKAGKKKKSNRQFQAETRQLLNLMIHSLYTHKEIFLRELLSNASDALDKVRFQSLTESGLVGENETLEIWLAIDKEKKTLSISDNGIGMTRAEVIDNIGTIARSGSLAFLKAAREQKEGSGSEDLDLIGQFGVGFYSSFMVAQKVELVSRSMSGDYGVRWVSAGEGQYTIEEIEAPERGTSITLHLRDEVLDPKDPAEDFLNQYTLQNLVRKYSDFINYPIKINFEKHDSGAPVEGEEKKEKKQEFEVRTLNSMKPLWERDKKEVKGDEYFQFYKHHFHDWEEPADILHVKAEGTVQYTALLFIPSKAPINLYAADYKKGIQLYSKHVFVMDRYDGLLPDHLRFVRGLVDSPDFSLNVSREILQNDRQIKLIAKNLEKKVMDSLKKMLKNKRDDYEKWWDEFGKAIKGGIFMQWSNKEKLQDYLLFPSSHKTEGMTTLREYVDRMPEWQEEIYYEAGKDREAIERLPQMEAVREKGVEVLYFTDKVDEFLTQNLSDYDDKKLKSVSRGDFTLDDKKDDDKDKDKDKKDDDKKEEEKSEHQDLLDKIKEHLGDRVKEVRVSKRLRNSAVCLVNPESGPSFNMELLMKEAGSAPIGRAQGILELNADHPVFGVLKRTFTKNREDVWLKEYSELLLSQAQLMEGLTLDNPVEFASRINDLMVRATKG
ncbi:MAG: molecular chaperone HtpG [Acidobacteriota bacterium]|nr:molecular chaperone HtpG [Acidobacteriota bacterium]